MSHGCMFYVETRNAGVTSCVTQNKRKVAHKGYTSMEYKRRNVCDFQTAVRDQLESIRL